VLKRFLAHAAQRVVGGIAISTRRVARCAHQILDAPVSAVLARAGLRTALRRGLAYLLRNARCSNVDRDRRTGRLRAGLDLVEVAYVITYEAGLASQLAQRQRQGPEAD